MNVPPEVIWSVAIPSVGAFFMWAKSVESRLASNDAVIQKIGRLADLLLEDRLDGHGSTDRRPQA